MIRAVIFDMDGVLIDSEPLWRDVEVRIYQSLGVPITLEMTKETMGLRLDTAVGNWFERFPWKGKTIEEVMVEIEAGVCSLINSNGEARRGVYNILSSLQDRGLPMAIASSSSKRVIQAVVDRLGIQSFIKCVRSAEDELYGKPHPGLYIKTAKALNVAPVECLVFEDSPTGVLAAKAARMKCIAIPEKEMLEDARFGIADSVIESFDNFDSSGMGWGPTAKI